MATLDTAPDPAPGRRDPAPDSSSEAVPTARGGRVAPLAALTVLLVASVAARWPALINARGVHSDAAIVGTQAQHIRAGEWSWFLWGAGYQSSFDAALTAAVFAVTGPSALALMVVPLVGHLLLVGLTFDVVRRAAGTGAAFAGSLLLVFAPQSINGVALYAPRQWSITAMVLAVWLVAVAAGRPRRAPWSTTPWFAAGGFAAVFAVYLDLFTLQMLPAVALFAVWAACPTLGGRPASWPSALHDGRRPLVALAGGAAVGGLVLAWSRAQPVADATKAGLSLDRVAANAELLLGTGLPYLFGIRLLRSDDAAAAVDVPAPFGYTLLAWIGALVFVAASAYAAAAVLRGTGPVAVRRLGVLGLVGTAASIGGYLVSTMPVDHLSTRYLAPIVWLAPFTLAPAAHRLGAARFTAALAPLVVAVGVGGWVAYGDYVDGITPVRDARGVAVDEAALRADLRALGVTHAEAQYWLAYRLTFLFDSDPVVVPSDGDRYAPYRQAYDDAPRVAHLFHPSEPRQTPEPVEAALVEAGVPYERLELHGFTVLLWDRP